jgi:Spy/CpxP family protein refolding chaperone
MRAIVRRLLSVVLWIGLALPATAQMMGPPVQGGPMGTQGRGMMGPGARPGPMYGREGGWSSHEGPLISIMLGHAQELGLTPDQERKLRDLRTEYAKESVRRTADIRVAEIELTSLLEQDKWDLAKIEPKVKQIATLQGDLRLARIKTLAAGREVLTPEQVEKLKQIGHRMRPGSAPGEPNPGMMGPGHPYGPGMPGPTVPGPSRP